MQVRLNIVGVGFKVNIIKKNPKNPNKRVTENVARTTTKGTKLTQQQQQPTVTKTPVNKMTEPLVVENSVRYLQLNVGTSHPYFIPIPALLDVSVIEATANSGSAILINPKQEINSILSKLSSVEKEEAFTEYKALITNFAATLKSIPKKDVYKGKGLHYDTEVIKLKAVNKK